MKLLYNVDVFLHRHLSYYYLGIFLCNLRNFWLGILGIREKESTSTDTYLGPTNDTR